MEDEIVCSTRLFDNGIIHVISKYYDIRLIGVHDHGASYWLVTAADSQVLKTIDSVAALEEFSRLCELRRRDKKSL